MGLEELLDLEEDLYERVRRIRERGRAQVKKEGGKKKKKIKKEEKKLQFGGQ